MKITKKIFATIAISSFALFGFSACSDDDVGDKIEEGVEEVEDEVDDAT